MSSSVYKLKLKVWQWPNSQSRDGGWHFVTLPKNVSKKIRDKHGKGMKKIEVIIGKTKYNTSLLWHNIDQAYLVAIKKVVRKKEDVFKEDMVALYFKII